MGTGGQSERHKGDEMKLDKRYAVLQIQSDGVNHQVIKTTDDLGEAAFQMQMGIDLVLVEVVKRDYIPTDVEIALNRINKEVP